MKSMKMLSHIVAVTVYVIVALQARVLASNATNRVRPPCEIKVTNGGIRYFNSQLLSKQPHFVQFKIKTNKDADISVGENVFQPNKWSWTFNAESSGPYPFISWDLDYGILSFHLLESKSVSLGHEIELEISGSCNLTYGTDDTLVQLVEAFVPLINVSTDDDFPIYTESYFCHYQVHRLEMNTANYIISQYFIYNLEFIEYKCAVVFLNFTTKTSFDVKPLCRECVPKRQEWLKNSYFPHVFGVLALLYGSPIFVFSIAKWLTKYEKIISNEALGYEEYEIIDDEEFELVSCDTETDETWFYADGVSHPLNVSDIFSFDTLGLAASHPYLIGRIRRLIFVLLVPSIIYAQIYMYSQGMGMWEPGDKITVEDLVNLGAPIGFLSLLGDPAKRQVCFAYWLGGPVGVTCLYFALSFLFMVLPRSLKQITEDGLPTERCGFVSPLFLTLKQTVRFSKVRNKFDKIQSGYAKAIVVIKCRFYMLFATPFWKFVWQTQKDRWCNLCFRCTTKTRILKHLLFPMYLFFCMLEIALCVGYYGIPFCSFVTIITKGATRSLGYLKQQTRVMRVIFSFRISLMFVFIVFVLYTYIISLVFMKSLLFISQVLTYCFVAVILYPSVAFGYLFFFTVIAYYFIMLINSFSDGYMELLTTAVDLSRHIDANKEYVCNNNGHLNICNIKLDQIKDIKINGKLLDVSQDILRSIESIEPLKVREKNGVYGIPKSLFDMLVEEFKPVHRELLSLLFNAAVIIVFVAAFLSITTSCVAGPTSEISEVMHVIFIVVVGALPRLISSIWSHSNDILLREIEERQMEAVIIQYWKYAGREMRSPIYLPNNVLSQ